MGALDVLPLVDAKRYLNIPAAVTTDDAELVQDFIPPAVQRVAEHVGRELVNALSCSPMERLAVRVALGTYWRTQRPARSGGRGGAASGAAMDADSDPAGLASLRRRLTELLGEPATSGAAAGAAPRGVFPPATAWPDPVRP